MAINYTKIGWDTTKYVNPTNMNQMDDGIKAACDGVDAIGDNYVKATSSIYQTISAPSDTPALFKRSNNATKVSIGFENSNGVLGTLGISASKTPIFNDGADHEIALAENVLPLTAGVNKKLTGDLWLHGTGNRTLVIGDQSAGATGYLQLSNNQHYGLLFPLNLTGDRQYRLPDKTGTLALANDVVKGSNHPTNAGITPFNSASVGGIQIDAVTPSSTTPSISFGFDIVYNRIVIYKDTGNGMALWAQVPVSLF